MVGYEIWWTRRQRFEKACSGSGRNINPLCNLSGPTDFFSLIVDSKNPNCTLFMATLESWADLIGPKAVTKPSIIDLVFQSILNPELADSAETIIVTMLEETTRKGSNDVVGVLYEKLHELYFKHDFFNRGSDAVRRLQRLYLQAKRPWSRSSSSNPLRYEFLDMILERCDSTHDLNSRRISSNLLRFRTQKGLWYHFDRNELLGRYFSWVSNSSDLSEAATAPFIRGYVRKLKKCALSRKWRWMTSSNGKFLPWPWCRNMYDPDISAESEW